MGLVYPMYAYRRTGREVYPVNERNGRYKIMGLTDFLYPSCQAVTWSKEVALGYRRKSRNNYVRYILVNNLPGK